MKLKEWASRQGINYRTALSMFHRGSLPVPAWQTDTGLIIVDESKVASLAKPRGDKPLSETRRAFLKVAMAELKDPPAAEIERTWASLVAQLIVIRKARGISQAEFDDVTGWADGLTAKYEAMTRRPTADQLALWMTGLRAGADIYPKAA